MQLVPWLYVSTSLVDPLDSDFEVDRIVTVSRSRNAALGITGALIYTGKRFLQYIEGPSDAITAVRASIRLDERHDKLIEIAVEETDQRLFADWSLAYSGKSQFIEKVIDKALDESLPNCSSGEGAVKLLREFC